MFLPVINKPVTIIVSEGKEKGTYTSKLLSMSTNELVLTKPVLAGKEEQTTLSNGLKVIVDYQDDKDVPCHFESVVVELFDSQQGWMLLKCPDKIERYQRREEYRIPLSRPIILGCQSKELSGRMNDISGGGCSVWIDNSCEIRVNDIVEISFVLKSRKGTTPIFTRAEVVNVQNSDSENREKFCSLKFFDMREDILQGILEFIFNYQSMDIALHSFGREIMY